MDTNDTKIKIKQERSENESENEHVQDYSRSNSSFNLSNKKKNISKISKKKLIKNNEEDESERLNKEKIKSFNDWIKLELDDSIDSHTLTSDSFESDSERREDVSYSITIEKLPDKLDRIIKSNCKNTSIREEENTLLQSDREKLWNLKVKLIHKIPAQHAIGNYAGCRGLKNHEKQLFKKYGPLRKGTFSLQEDEIIENNWKMFCNLHDWREDNVKPFLSLKDNGKYYIHHFEERQKFVQFLANGLPWRTLYSVYLRFKTLYCNHFVHKYTLKEDRKIIAYMMKNENSINKRKAFSDLSKILNRSKQSVWAHYEFVLKKRNAPREEDISMSKPVWTLSLIKRYITELLRLTKCDDIEELKNAIIPKIIWTKLEMELNIHHKTLKNFWVFQLHMQLFCPNIIYMNDIKIQLIEYMYVKGIANNRDILWSSIVKYFDGMTSSFLNKIFESLMKESDVIKHRRKSFLDTIEYLYEKKIPEIQNNQFDRYLPRIKYTTDGNVQV